MSDTTPLVLLDSFSSTDFTDSWRFSGHVATLEAATAAEVPMLLTRIEEEVARGLYAAGFVAYEAAGALNPDLTTLPPLSGVPLAWFALFRERHAPGSPPEVSCQTDTRPELAPELTGEEYKAAMEQIRNYIGRGDCYQVNFTFPLTGSSAGETLPLYRQIARGQQAQFCSYLDTGRFVIMSASPELFFSRTGDRITVRPMKGTAPRGRWSGEDRELAAGLMASDKERAENLMIVDLLRNDLGKIAATGSVAVDALFQLESYPTVHQLTSTISATLKPGINLADIFRALFPCGSVTGAPKRRSMEIIAALEKSPRGVYCGAIGCLAPGGEATFAVPIRTLLLDRSASRLTLNVGSGVTWGSQAGAEYRECLGKAAFMTADARPFVLIETMGVTAGAIPRLERHLARLEASAGYFGYPFDRQKALALLSDVPAADIPQRLRLTLNQTGELALTVTPLERAATILRLGLAATVIDPADRFRYHKTSRRELLEKERLARGDCDELLFRNSRGELTEGSYHNLVLRLDGRLLTPALACGLLPGVLRQELLELGEISEAILYPADLERAGEIWLINSLRGWRQAVLAG